MTNDPLPAADDDPRISVHELAEFVFCPRAGLVTFETEDEDTGREPGVEHLDYLPDYNLRELKLARNRTADQLNVLVAGMALVLLATSVAAVCLSVHWMAAAAVPALGLIAGAINRGQRLWVLARRYAAYKRAEPREPQLESEEPEPIGWWELHKAGFEATTYQDPLLDDALRLIGRPWKVLRRGPWVVPVFKRRQPGPLRPQHFARIAAYCHLIATCEQAESPFGVVLDPDRYQATVIKNTRTARRQFARGLELARRIVLESRTLTDEEERRRYPGPPDDRKRCIRCPVGRPRRYRFGQTETVSGGVTLAPYGEIRSGQTYHSPCADRFCWTPPHELASQWGWVDDV